MAFPSPRRVAPQASPVVSPSSLSRIDSEPSSSFYVNRIPDSEALSSSSYLPQVSNSEMLNMTLPEEPPAENYSPLKALPTANIYNGNQLEACLKYQKIVSDIQSSRCEGLGNMEKRFIRQSTYFANTYNIDYVQPTEPVVHDSEYEKLEKMSKANIYQVAKELNITTTKSPVIVMIGPQSSGKSTVINRLLGINIAPSAPGTVTTSEVEYSVTQGETKRIEVDGNVIPGANEKKAEEEILNCMKQKDRVTVTICGPDYTSMVIHDTVGFTSDVSQKISKEMIQQHVSDLRSMNPTVFLVIPAPGDIQGATDMNLRYSFPGAEIIINQCDIQLEKWKKNFEQKSSSELFTHNYTEKIWMVAGKVYNNENTTDEIEKLKFDEYLTGEFGKKFNAKYPTTISSLRNYVNGIYHANMDKFREEVHAHLLNKKDSLLQQLPRSPEIDLPMMLKDEDRKIQEKIDGMCKILDGQNKDLSRQNIKRKVSERFTAVLITKSLDENIDMKELDSRINSMGGGGHTANEEAIKYYATKLVQENSNKLGEVMSVIQENINKLLENSLPTYDTYDYVHRAIKMFLDVMLSDIKRSLIEQCQIASRTVQIDSALKSLQRLRVIDSLLEIANSEDEKDNGEKGRSANLKYIRTVKDKITNSEKDIKSIVNIIVSNIALTLAASADVTRLEQTKNNIIQIVRLEMIDVHTLLMKRLDEIIEYYLHNKSGNLCAMIRQYIYSAHNIDEIRKTYYEHVHRQRIRTDNKIKFIDCIIENIKGT